MPADNSRLTTKIPHNTKHSLATCLIVVAGVSQSKKRIALTIVSRGLL